MTLELCEQMTFISPKKKKGKRVNDVFKAFLVEGARFTEIEQYPVIESWMVPSDVGEIKIVPFNKLNRVKDIENYYIGFYCRDRDLKSVYNNPKRYLPMFRRAKGIIGLDFSVYDDMPIVKQKAQIYDNLSFTFYYGMRNVPVIPNVRYGNDSTKAEYLNALPKETVIAIGSYGCVRSCVEKKNFRQFLDEMLPALNPKMVVVYGAMPEDVFGKYKEKYRFIRCPAFIEYEMKGGKNDVCAKRA